MSKKTNPDKLQNKKFEKQELKKKKLQKTLIIALCVLLTAALLTTLTIFTVKMVDNHIKDRGDKYRETIVFESENYTVDAAMMSYFFYDMLYDGILERYNVKNPEDLKELTYDADQKKDLYSYYGEYAATLMRNYILYAESAIDRGTTLDEKELSRINERLAAFSDAASSLGLSEKEYIFGNYGRGVNTEDIRKVLELTTLADKHLATVYNAQEATPEEIAEYLASNDALKYYRVDYYMIDFTIGVDPTEGAYKAEYERIQKIIDELVTYHSLDEFLKKAKEFYTKEYTDEDGKLTIDITIDELIADCLFKEESVKEVTDESDVIDEWAYDFGRKEGDTLKVDGKRTLAAMFMVRPAYSVDTPATAVRYIAIDGNNYAKTSDALARLNELKKEIEKDPSEAKIIELAEKYSEDAMNAANGGLCEDTYASDAFSQAIANWLTSSKQGEHTTVTVNNCYYLVYNCGEGRTRSEIDAELTIRGQKYSKVLEECSKNIEIDIPDKTVIGFYAPLQ